ncbi:MAG TPA: DsbA family protein [Acidimicrobiales bacterium]|nr:DsbA family protein [Acidimicrobiales bacterium]
MTDRPADLDFFWDPVCPWAWITSRWVHEVIAERGIEVDWRPISLKVLNEEKGYPPELVERYTKSHGLGFALLKVAAAARERHGPAVIGELYTAFGRRIHVEREAPSLRTPEGIAAVLESCGLDAGLADATITDTFEAEVRTETAVALERAGKDVGTPVLTFGPPDGYSFFGPVIAKAPVGAEAARLWDTVTALASFPGFAELKRSIRNTPEVS